MNETLFKSGFTHEASGGSNQNEWLTPPDLIRSLGEFDLDPCAPKVRPWDMAKHHFHESGLQKQWFGRVWLNPPYGNRVGDWMRRLVEHKNGVALIFARTDTSVFHDVIFPNATAILFMAGRIKFYKPDGTQGDCAAAPSTLIAFDETNARAIAESGNREKLVKL